MQDLVMIPGLLCTGELFTPQLQALSSVARIHIADHTRGATMREIAGSILTLAPRSFALCGLSMGGYLAFEIMRRAPERVSRLALLDTAAKADTPERAAGRADLVARAEAEGISEVAKTLWPSWIHPSRLSDPSLLETVARMTANTGLTHFARQQAAIASRQDSIPNLRGIRVPTLVMVGRQDQATTVEDAEVIARGISGSTLTIIKDCAHLSTLEQPEAVNSALHAWLGG